MPVFSYKAARSDGEVIEGRVDATDSRAVAQRLQAEGQTPIQITEYQGDRVERPARLSFSWQRSSLNQRDIELFTLQLSNLLRAGLSLGSALETLSRLAEKPAMQEMVQNLNQAIRRGESLSAALTQTNPLFDRFYLNMVRAGESAGALDLALQSLSEFKTKSREMRESLISSLIYPGILLTLALVAVAVMLAFVVPQFTEMFNEAGQDLPVLTRIVAGTGELITGWWWLMLALAAGGFYMLRRYWETPAGRQAMDNQLLRLPIAGNLQLKVETARFTRTLSTLLKSGVSLLVAIDIAKETVGNRVVSQMLERTASRVRQGEGLGKPLAESRIFPTLATQLIQVGERSGNLEPMLDQVAEIYEREVETGLQRLLGLVEPAIIVFIGVFVSIIILSIVMLILASNDLVF